MKRARWLLAFCFCSWRVLCGVNYTARAETLFASSPHQTALIELFTSEGCSSCPPAEAWLSRLTQHSNLWTEFVPVAFHVDYWDHLGWKDRFASEHFTQRQRAYVAAWRGRTIYTPGFVVNGRERGSTGSFEMLTPGNGKPGVLQVERAGKNGYAVRFNPAGGLDGPFDIHVVLLDCGIRVKVSRGENAGRELRHDFVARSWRTTPLPEGGKPAPAEIQLPSPPVEGGSRRALAVWVTQRGKLTPMQATGGWLN